MNKPLKRKIITGVNLASALNKIKNVNKLLKYIKYILHFFFDLEFNYIVQEAEKVICELYQTISVSVTKSIRCLTDR